MAESGQTMPLPDQPVDGLDICVGNAAVAGVGRAGWFIGRFLPEHTGLRRADALEVKWGVHASGENRAGVSVDAGVYSLAILVSGIFALSFPSIGKDVLLSRVGDYALYGPGLPHDWHAVEDSTVVTIRWPEPPDDSRSQSVAETTQAPDAAVG